MKKKLLIFLNSTFLIVLILLLPLFSLLRVITELFSIATAVCVKNAGIFGEKVWSFMERLLLVFIIGFILTSCVQNYPMNKDEERIDTVVIKTDSCHFYMDSANYCIDELKIEYVK